MKARTIHIFAAIVLLGSAAALIAEPPERQWERSSARGRQEREPGMHEESGVRRRAEMQGRMSELIERIAANPELRESLEITEEQLSILRNSSYEMQKQQVDLRAAMEKASLEQARLMTQPEVDEDAVMKMIDKVGVSRSELAKLHVKQLLLLKKTLTQEQIHGLRRHMWEGAQKHNRRTDRLRERDDAKEKRGQRRDRDAGARRQPEE